MTASDDMEVLLEHGEEPLKPTSIRRRTLAFAAIALALAGAAAVSLRKPSQALPSQAYSVTGLSEDEGCFKKGMFYDGPEKLDGTEKTVEESPQKCQARCETEDRCVHFTFWPDGGCSLTGNASHIKAATDELSNTTVGPKSCKDVATLSAATNTTAKTAAATPTTATTQVPLSETKSNFAPIIKKAASMVQYVVMPDVIKISQDIMRGHFQFSTLQAPDEFLPDKATLANMSTAQLTARKEYWMTFMASEFAATVGIGSAIMVTVPPLKQSLRQWMLPETPYDRVDTARSEAFQTNIQRTIVASSFGTTFIAATAFVMYSVEHDSLSKLFGLDFEFYAALETLGCNWLLAQAVWATCACQPADRYEATIFLEASVFGVAPVLSDPYDSTKDIMFAGLCLRSTSKLLNALGVLSLIWLLVVHVWFLSDKDLVNELAATYASVLYARKKHKDDTPKEMKIKLAMFSQTTWGKVKVLLGEGVVQACGAVVYLIEEGGSLLVLTLNLGIPVAQLIFALAAREYLGKQVRGFLMESASKALADGQMPKVRFLLDQAADAMSDGWTHLHFASTAELAELLLKEGADANAKVRWGYYKGCRGLTPLHRAGNAGVAELLLKVGADANSKNEDDLTPLHFAKSADVAELLLKAGADANAKSLNNLTPLHFAKSADVAELLLKAGADANAKDSYGTLATNRTPLHYATNAGVAEALLKAGADANSTDYHGETPLHRAGNADVAELLLKAGADANAKNEDGNTPLHFAKSADVAELLLKAGADANSKNTGDSTPLHFAKSADVAELLLKAGADANAKSLNSKTPLDYASENDVKAVLRRYMGTLLHRAAQVGDVKQAQFLIESGADANSKDQNDQQTPLHMAKNADVAEVLLKAGADANAKNRYGYTPLHLAENADVAEVLLKAGADANSKDNEGQSPFKKSVDNGQVEVIEVLLATGNADRSFLTAKDGDGMTLLHRAAHHGDMKCVRGTIAAGADINAKDKYDWTPLHRASEQGHAGVAEVLLKAGADANAKNEDGTTPLHRASDKGHAGVAELLLKAGADANAKDRYGDTPLARASKDEVKAVLRKYKGQTPQSGVRAVLEWFRGS